MQHHLRDPNRDQDHGRIYRITYEGRPLLTQPKIDGQPIPALLDLLKEPENRTRELAKIELGKRDTAEVIAAVNKWITTLESQRPRPRARPDGGALGSSMAECCQYQSPPAHAPFARSRRPAPPPDASSVTGATACRARSAFSRRWPTIPTRAFAWKPCATPAFSARAEAADAALTALKHPTDYYLDYTLDETMRQLKPWVLKAIANHESIAADNPAGLNYLISTFNSAELLKLPGTDPDVERPGRTQGRHRFRSPQRLERTGQKDGHRPCRPVVRAFWPQARYRRSRPGEFRAFVDLAAARPIEIRARQPGQAGLERARARMSARPRGRRLAMADNSFDTVWKEAGQSPAAFADMLNGIPFLNDSDLRAKPYDRVLPLLNNPAPPSATTTWELTG